MALEADSSVQLPIAAPVGARVKMGLWRLGRGARRNPTMAYGIGIVIIMVLIAIMAPILFTSDPSQPKPTDRFQSPSFSGHWFGTDNIGRDVYSRTIYGARVSLTVAAAVATIAISAGAIIGLISGYFSKADMVIMRVVDGFMSIPSILLAMALMALLGGSVQNVIIALSITQTPIAVRIVRSSVLTVKQHMYVDAARAMGAPAHRVLRQHVFPNIIAPLIVQATFIASAAVLLEAYLSFLGAGTPPETSSWGVVMADAQSYISRAVWVIMFPGIFLTLTVLGISLAGDGLRDTLDPKLRRRM